MAQQTKALKSANTPRKQKGEAFLEMDQAGYLVDRPLKNRLTKAKTFNQKLIALSDKELNQAITNLAKKGGTLELKRGLFAERKRRESSKPKATEKPKEQTPLQAIASKINQATDVEGAFRSFTDSELKLASQIFAERNVGTTNPFKRKLAAELRRRVAKPTEDAPTPAKAPTAPQKPQKSNVVPIGQGRPKMPTPKTAKEAIANGQKLLGKDYDRLQQLGKESAALSKSLNPRTNSTSVISRAEKRIAAIGEETQAIMRNLIDKSPVSRQDAETMLKQVKLSQELDTQDRETVIDFLILSNGQAMEALKVIKYTNAKLGKANAENGIVEIRRGQPKSIWHELGHLVEHTQANSKAAIGSDFIQGRATGERRSLKEIDPKYSESEQYLPDKFVTPYVGKVYEGDSTEVFSMGIDAFSDPKRLLNLAAKDPEHLALTLGVFQQDYVKPSNVVPMRKQTRAAEALNEDMGSVGQTELKRITSVVTKDLEYLQAIAKGDTAKTEAMVADAAKTAGYDTPVTHLTDKDFNEFSIKKATDKLGRQIGLGLGKDKFYFTHGLDSQITREDRPRKINAFLKIEKPLTQSDFESMVANQAGVKEYFDLRGFQQKDRDKAIATIDKQIKKQGYDGILQKDKYGIGQIAVYNPNRIKLADRLTTNDQGIPIPLSARFDDSVADIRGNVNDVFAGLKSQAGEALQPLIAKAETQFAAMKDKSVESLIKSIKGLQWQLKKVKATEAIQEDVDTKTKYDKDVTDPLFAEKMVDKFMQQGIDYDSPDYDQEEEKAKRKVFDYYIDKYDIDPEYEGQPLYDALEGDLIALSAYAGAWVVDEDDWEKYGLAWSKLKYP